MTYNIPRNLHPVLQRLPTLLNLLLVILIAFALARLFWMLWPVEQTYVPVSSSDRPAPGAAQNSIAIDQIAAAYLFGQENKKEATAPGAGEVIDAPETQLNLILTGIVASNQGRDSRALIKDDKNEQKPYAVGDSIISNVKLHAIYENRVILDRSGRFETLTLEQDKKNKQTRSKIAQRSKGRSNTVSASAAQSIGEARAAILQDPSKAAQYLRIQPERRNGKLAGYRVYPGSDRSLFQKVGLRPGELVTAINGQPLDNPSESLKLLGDLSQAQSVSVTLERGGQTRTLNVSFQ